jgi:hypothetical protein
MVLCCNHREYHISGLFNQSSNNVTPPVIPAERIKVYDAAGISAFLALLRSSSSARNAAFSLPTANYDEWITGIM